MVDTGSNHDVPIDIDGVTHQDVVDRRGHHPACGIKTVYIRNGGLFGHDVQLFEE